MMVVMILMICWLGHYDQVITEFLCALRVRVSCAEILRV